MAETLAINTEYIKQEWREKPLRYDLRTQFAELVNGSMRTDFELRLVGDDLIGEDDRGLREIANKGLAEAKVMAKLNPKLWFGVRRCGFEADEIDEAIAMARGDGPNTMIIESDFPQELMAATEDVGGYNVVRKQNMQRVLIRGSNGVVHMYSQSLDGSNRQALEAIYANFGIEPEPGELLPQRIRVDLPETQQSTLIDDLTAIYDRNLASQFGGAWYAGRRQTDYRNTYEFVCQQSDLIEECVRLEKLGWLNSKFMYNVAAEMNKRFLASEHNIIQTVSRLTTASPAVLHHQLEQAGAEARQMGLAFSACGVTLRAEGIDNSTENQMDLAGYGNKSGEDKYGPLTFKCEKGHTNTRPPNKLIDKCTTCGKSVSCGPKSAK